MGRLARHRSMHGDTIPVHSGHGRSKLTLSLELRLGITLRISSRMSISYWGHGGNVGVRISLRHLSHLHHPLDFFLSLMLKLLEFFFSEHIIRLIQSVPSFIFVVFISLCFSPC